MAEVDEYLEYGVQDPKGNFHWGTYLGRSLTTDQDRGLIVLVLRKTAEELGFEEAEFLKSFKWVSRVVEVLETRHDIDLPEIAPNLSQAPPAE